MNVENMPTLGLSVRQLAEGYAARRFSPVEIARLYIAQVEKAEPLCKAWVCFDAEKYLAAARETERRIMSGAALRPLEGVPVGVKDIMNTAEFPTQMGSPLWAGFTPGNDARVVFQAKQAGAIIPGKTVTAEFAVHTLGKTENPHDRLRNPGTSSSGSAVAIAAGMVPVTLGTQTAGSIVRPASYCGIYGVKPSFGLIPRTGMLKTTDSLDTVGFFVGCLEDAMPVFDILRVHGRDYPLSSAALADPARQEKPQGRPWRVAVVKTHTWPFAQDYAKEAFLDWTRKLSATGGIEVSEASLPTGLERIHEVHSLIYDRALAYYFQEEYKKAELVSPIMNDIIRHGNEIAREDYWRAMEEQLTLAGKMDEFFGGYDILISLSTAGHAPLRDEPEPRDPALIWTATHLPVISAPALLSPHGLPCGVQIAARRYNDYLLFKFAANLCKEGLLPPSTNPRFNA